MINYVVGDLFELMPQNQKGLIFIPHVVNNISRMGSGFVVPLNKKWPKTYDSYMDKNRLFLGDVDFIKVESTVYVCNMVAQSGVVGPNNPKPIKYEALVKCMKSVLSQAFGVGEIHAPMFGSKLAGGNWLFIEELINEIWDELSVTIYKLED